MKRNIFLGTFLLIFTIGLSQSGAKIEFLNNEIGEISTKILLDIPARLAIIAL